MTDQELNQFIQERTELIIANEYHLYSESIFIESIFNSLTHRKWILVEAFEQTGPIITSDNPLIVCWNDPETIPISYRYSPGYTMKNTTVYFSLSQKLSLIGTFDGDDIVSSSDKNLVAVNNTMHLRHAHRQIYAPSFQFRFLTKDNGLQDGLWLKKQIGIVKK